MSAPDRSMDGAAIFDDTFSSGSSLASHSADSGQSWQKLPVTDVPTIAYAALDRYVIVGGNMGFEQRAGDWIVSPPHQEIFPSAVAPPISLPADCWIEIELNLNPWTGGEASDPLNVWIEPVDISSGVTRGALHANPHIQPDGSGTCDLQISGDSAWAEAIPLLPTNNVLRVERRGDVLQAFFNEVASGPGHTTTSAGTPLAPFALTVGGAGGGYYALTGSGPDIQEGVTYLSPGFLVTRVSAGPIITSGGGGGGSDHGGFDGGARHGLVKDKQEGFAGEMIPGQPAIPASPAYCHDVVTVYPPGTPTLVFIYDPGNPATMRPPGYIGIYVAGPGGSEVHQECYPASPGRPAGPPTKIPAVEADFFPGWNAAADSIASVPAAGQFRVAADPSAVGIVTGFTAAPSGTTYANITHGFYFASGAYQIMESGSPLTPPVRFAKTDQFLLARDAAGVVLYFRNGALQYSSSALSTGVVFVDAAEYFGGDTILDAALEPYAITPPSYGGGAMDPAPPPGTYRPGDGPVPPPPPGEILRWNSCNGTLQPPVVWAGDVAGATGVQPGPGPNPGDLPDPDGDWPGRTGGTLRMLVGHAEGGGYGNWNSGEVHGVLGGLAVEAYGSAGDGTHYSICRGTLGDLVGNAGANQLTPQYAVCRGLLQPVAGFATTLVGAVGQVAGRLGELVAFGSDLAGGWVDSDGPPPFQPPIGAPGGGGGALYHDTFTGTTTLDLHVPDVGVLYLMDGGTPLDGLTLTGSALPIGNGSGGNFDIEQPLDVSATPSYRTRHVLQIDSVGSTGTLTIDVALDAAETDDWFYEWWLVAATDGSIFISFYIYGADGSELFVVEDIDLTSAFTLGVPHTLTMTITPAGVVWALDGTELANSGGIVSDGVVTGIEANFRSYAGASAVFDEIEVAPLGVGGPPPVGGWEPDAQGDWPGRMGGQLRQLVARAYSLDAYATGGSFDNRHSGHYQLLGYGHSPTVANDPVTGFPVGYGLYGLHGGHYLLAAWGGGLFSIVGPAGDLVAAGTAAIVATFDQTGPAGSLIIEGTVGIAGGFNGLHFGGWTLDAYGGGNFNAIGPHGVLGSSTGGTSAVGDAGIAMTFAVTGPAGILTITGLAYGDFGTFDVVGPALQPLYGELFSVGPSGLLVAQGTPPPAVVDPATDTEGYSITLMEDGDGVTTATSRYTQFPFERIVRFGSVYFGITPTGIYQLGGDLFDTAKIVAQVNYPPHDFKGSLGRGADHADQRIKTMRSIMLAGHIPASVQVTVVVDDDGSSAAGYSYTPEPTDTARNHRIDVGRGLEGRYIAMSLTNPDGKDFTLQETSAEFDVSKQRNVWRR